MRYQENLISVIVPVYNVAQYLPKCIDSIMNQTYRDLEIILVNDGSTDNSGEICTEYENKDTRIKVIHQENNGVVSARKTGISNATGGYIAFVDADDWLDECALESMHRDMKDADLIAAGYWKNYPQGEELGTNHMPAGVYATEQELHYFYENMMYYKSETFDDSLASIWNKLFRLEIIKQFYEKLDDRLHYEEDAVFLYTYFLRCNKIVVSEDAFYHYRIRENSAVNSVYQYFLADVNHIYLYLEKLFSTHACADVMLLRLQQWIEELVFYGINEKMGFKEEAKLPLYLLPYQDLLADKKVILYGAGKIGKEYMRSMRRSRISPLLWVDASYEKAKQAGLPVEPVEHIHTCEFDYILLAIKEEKMANSIRANLEQMGIPGEKILWKRPIMFFER